MCASCVPLWKHNSHNFPLKRVRAHPNRHRQFLIFFCSLSFPQFCSQTSRGRREMPERWSARELFGWLKFVNGKMATKYSEFRVQTAGKTLEYVSNAGRVRGNLLFCQRKLSQRARWILTAPLAHSFAFFWGYVTAKCFRCELGAFWWNVFREIGFKEFAESNFSLEFVF